MSVPLSVLDLAPIGAGQSAAEALAGTTRLAQRADELGFRRFWVAEHHNIPSVASTSPEVLVAHIAASTDRIRVGSGGVMLPNHAPLAVAERFGMLEALHPDRIDLGLGRAPGTDMRTAMALRSTSPERFGEQFEELRGYLGAGYTGIRAVAGEHTEPELWMLGSTDGGARIAAELGLPFVFAHHFHPHFTEPALELYRSLFRPSELLGRRARSSPPGSSSATTTRTPPAARCDPIEPNGSSAGRRRQHRQAPPSRRSRSTRRRSASPSCSTSRCAAERCNCDRWRCRREASGRSAAARSSGSRATRTSSRCASGRGPRRPSPPPARRPDSGTSSAWPSKAARVGGW